MRNNKVPQLHAATSTRPLESSRTLTMFVGVVTLCHQYPKYGGVDNGVRQLLQKSQSLSEVWLQNWCGLRWLCVSLLSCSCNSYNTIYLCWLLKSLTCLLLHLSLSITNLLKNWNIAASLSAAGERLIELQVCDLSLTCRLWSSKFMNELSTRYTVLSRQACRQQRVCRHYIFSYSNKL